MSNNNKRRIKQNSNTVPKTRNESSRSTPNRTRNAVDRSHITKPAPVPKKGK
ncbi:hypothetical protein LJC02_01835 [Breznakia sp. OttesenSCG-928-G09]|nr:hypothetical protein [Breznakia sp. OttesenSCG-928-G09]